MKICEWIIRISRRQLYMYKHSLIFALIVSTEPKLGVDIVKETWGEVSCVPRLSDEDGMGDRADTSALDRCRREEVTEETGEKTNEGSRKRGKL